MLIQKLNKKFGANSSANFSEEQINQIISSEVNTFIRNEKVTRESLKSFEAMIDEKLGSMTSPKNGGKLTKTGSQALMQSGRSILSNSKQGSIQNLPRIDARQKQSSLPRNSNAFGLQDEGDDAYEEYGISKTFDIQDNYATQPIQKAGQDLKSLLSAKQGQYSPEPGHRSIRDDLSNADEWAEVDKYNQLKYEYDQVLLKEKIEQSKANFKQTLDQQVREKRGLVNEKQSQKKQFDNMVIRQVEDYKKDSEQKKQDEMKKLLQQKNVREQQYLELIQKKQDALLSKKEYERKMVNELNDQLRRDKEKNIKKKLDFMEEFHRASKINQDNKLIKVDLKEQERLFDIQLQKEAIERVDRLERERREEYVAREARIAAFMKASEQNAVAEDNKKHMFLQQMIDQNEAKKQHQDYLNDELKKKRQSDQQRDLRHTLSNQIEEKRMKSRLHKEVNAEYVHVFKSKAESEIEKEKREQEEREKKMKEVQDEVLRQIEEKKQRAKGMSQYEYGINKDLLREISEQKSILRDTLKGNSVMNSTFKPRATHYL